MLQIANGKGEDVKKRGNIGEEGEVKQYKRGRWLWGQGGGKPPRVLVLSSLIGGIGTVPLGDAGIEKKDNERMP